MSQKQTKYRDGIHLTPFLVETGGDSFPFAHLGDTATAVYTRTFQVEKSAYSAVTIGAVDSLRSGHYVIEQSQPVLVSKDVLQYTVTYSAIPATTEEYSSYAVTTPDWYAAGTAFTSFSDIYFTQDWRRVNISDAASPSRYADTIQASSITLNATTTAGTFTVTYGANTTGALAYNCTITTLIGAINGLASAIADGLTLSSGSGGTTINTLPYIELNANKTPTYAFSINTSGLTPNAPWQYDFASGKVWFYKLDTVSVTGHGIVAGDYLARVYASTTSGCWIMKCVASNSQNLKEAVYGNANTLYLYLGVSDPVYVGKLFEYTVAAASRRFRATVDYFLPGVSIGITTPEDIPLGDDGLTDAGLTQAMLQRTVGWVQVGAPEISIWRGSIYKRVTKEVYLI